MWDAISKFDVSSIPKTWKSVTMSPLVSNALLSGGAALASYYAAPFALKKYIGALPASLQGEALAELEDPENLKKLRRKAALAAGLATLGLTTWQTSSLDHPKSFVSWDWGIQKEEQDMTGGGMESLMQLSNPLWNKPTVPVQHSTELIWNDRFIPDSDKDVLTGIFDTATNSDRSGLVSAKQLARGAVRLGLGYIGGHVAGNVLGRVLSLPPATTSVLSRTGGLANMLMSSGVIGP